MDHRTGHKLGNYTILLLSTIVTLVAGGIGGAVGISGTPIAAGFGISGLVGPLAALNYEGWGWTAGKLAIIAMVFIALPLVMSILFNFLFSRIGWVRSEHYKLDFK
ncbi:PTS sugar transporter subunit IIC [Corynebacterium xerosis]|uniref:PTS sugar transporter subunit IIC n=1 Tax=Corynebacterium xerosis TaxID=1725 RepID=UPI0027B89BEA|nr:PTS sugar transporter subunit IIC [Corynebacterium xerosis]